MTQEHPITPPEELVDQWNEAWIDAKVKHEGLVTFIANQAARWGADEELEACLMEIRDGAGRVYIDETKLRVCLADDIWTVRRPHPPSLKEQALQALDLLKVDASTHGLGFDSFAIRRALESLPD